MSDSTSIGSRTLANPILARTLAFTVGVCALWILPGLVGHDPWKPDEAYSLGLAYHILHSGDWVVPTLADEPFLQRPPFHPLSAAFFANLFGAVLPLHDAARLTSGVYMAFTFVLVGLSARELLGNGRGWLAVLVLLGSLGLLLPAHQLTPEVSELTGFALALYGFALCLRRPVLGGLALGTGVGLGFMSKGLLAPACLGLTAVLLPAIAPLWRTRAYAVTLAVALLAMLPWLLIWPIALFQRSPELFHEWWWSNNLGRYFAHDGPALPVRPGFYLGVLPWFAFPSLPLAVWAIWTGREKLRSEPALLVPLVMACVVLVLLSAAPDARDLYALPILVPLAVLAVPGLLSLRRGATNAFWWFSILFAFFMALMAWFEWMALDLGFPGARHRHWLRLQPGYVPQFDLFAFALALAFTYFMVWVVLRLQRSPERPLVAWAAGVSMVWALAVTMFLEYVDTGKSYRSMAVQIARALPEGHRCVASLNLGGPQRALLQYFAGIVAYRSEAGGRSANCDVLLVQGSRERIHDPGPEWIEIWQGARLGDRKELYRLYRSG
jgi:4-amino-4-deoxy-L-arabinose transferase-like glycosyltransferase